MTSGSQARWGAVLAVAMAFAGGCVVGRASAPTGALVAGASPTHVDQKPWWEERMPASSHPAVDPAVPASTKASLPDATAITPERFDELSQAARRDPGVAWTLLQRLRDTPDAVARFTLANVLAQSQRAMLTAQIQQWMGSDNKQDRALAFDLLRNVGDMPPEAAHATRRVILEESDPALLTSALAAFRPSVLEGGPAEAEAMIRQLRLLSQNPNAEVRQQSLSKLIEVDHGPGVEADLTRALHDPDIAVRMAAIDGLLQAGVRNEAVTGELVRLSTDAATDGPVRVSAMEALSQFRLTPEQQQQLKAAQGR